MPKTKNLKNQVFGQWTILKYDGIAREGPGIGNSFWWCKCSCGYEKSVQAQTLLNGTSTKCRECADKQQIIDFTIPHHYWRVLVRNALKRNIEILTSEDECFKLLLAQNFKCALSGLDIYMSKNNFEHKQGKTTASLDRIDSSKPYIINNLQWLHKDVNMMKHIFNQSYFIDLCRSITNKNKS